MVRPFPQIAHISLKKKKCAVHLPPEKPGLVLFRIRVKVTDILLGTCQITVQGEGREAKGDRAQEHMWQVKERERLSQETHVSPTAQPDCRLKHEQA